MKWVTLFKDIKEKAGLTHSPSSSSSTTAASSSSPFAYLSNRDSNASPTTLHDFTSSPARDRDELELDFKRFWEEFRSSSSEKEKEAALNLSVDTFCRLVKQHSNVAQLVTMLVETHIFSFVVGRAFVTDIEKLKISNKTRSLDAEIVLRFFSEVSKPIDKQSLLDSGILCCLIHVLNALLNPEGNQRQRS